MTDYKDNPHRRFNPLTYEWVLVSPHRTQRPWQGMNEPKRNKIRPKHDPECYLCPGNHRAGGKINPDYQDVFVFDNDFAPLLPDTPPLRSGDDSLFRAESLQGVSRVICFSPRHDLTLPEMAYDDIRAVVDVWADQTNALGKSYRWVQIFENKGEMMGCSNPHPHCQIWAANYLPNEPFKEDLSQKNYSDTRKENMLLTYMAAEQKTGERLVLENEHWLAVVPFWAIWPYETLLAPKRHVIRFPDLTADERGSLVDVLKRLLIRYDNMFETSFPYSMGWHGAPFNQPDIEHWQLHAHFYPPLLRSATIKKFMVGYEMLAEAQRDITAERAAELLRNQNDIHYKALAI